MKDKLKLVSLVGIAIAVLSFGLLAIPGQFYDIMTNMKSSNPPHLMSGYQFIFNSLPDGFKSYSGVYGAGVSGLGVAALVIMAVAAICFGLYFVSSALPLFGGVASIVSGLFFLLMKPWGADKLFKAYKSSSAILWSSYVIGALLFLVGVAAIYFSIKLLKEEKAHPKETVGYSYLKK